MSTKRHSFERCSDAQAFARDNEFTPVPDRLDGRPLWRRQRPEGGWTYAVVAMGAGNWMLFWGASLEELQKEANDAQG